MFLHYQFWHWPFQYLLAQALKRLHILCVRLMNYITAQIKSGRWTWSSYSGIIQQRIFVKGDRCGCTLRIPIMQSHLMQAKWFRFSLIFFFLFLWFGEFTFSCWTFISVQFFFYFSVKQQDAYANKLDKANKLFLECKKLSHDKNWIVIKDKKVINQFFYFLYKGNETFIV